jgi:hypothetical protein
MTLADLYQQTLEKKNISKIYIILYFNVGMWIW